MADESIQRWNGHAGVARLIRIAIVVVPFSASVAMAFALSNRLPIAESVAGRGLRLLVILIAATATMMLVDRLARRLLPLSALFHLTLIFPDQAPSRFKIALKTSSAVDLEERIAAAMHAPEGETRGEAAERLLELVGLLSHHDQITRGHSERVRAYTQILGEEMGLTETELDKIRWAGLLHDVGKTTIPAEILNKPGKLTADEFDIIKGHPEAGRRLVEPLEDWLGDSLRAVWEHHERWDGTGYPRQLSGTDISLGARIVSVADTYDVITSARSYKRPLSAVEARAELARCAGEQFDPVVVRAFLNISLGKLRWMAGPSAWFAQLSLFEPTGVVHAGDGGSGIAGVAGSSGAGSSTAGAAAASASGTTAAAGSAAAAGATTASTTATALTSVAAVGSSSSVVGTLAVMGVGVAAGTTGVVAADGPLPSETEVETAFVEDAGPVAAVDEPIVLDQEFAPRVTLVRESAGESGADEDGVAGVFAPTESVDVPAAAPATAIDGDLAEAGVAIASDDGDPGSESGADTNRSGGDGASPPENDQPQVGDSVEPDASGSDSDGPSAPTSATTTTTTVPPSDGTGGGSGSTATTVPTTVPPVVTVPTNPTVPTTVAVTVPTTTAPPVTTVPPTTVPPTTVPPAPTTTTLPPPPVGSLDPAATTFFLEAGSSWSPWWGTLGDVAPADVPLVDLDPWGDGDAGLTLPKTSAGVSSLIPGHVAVFRSSVDAEMILERIESLELFVAANDFDREDVHVAASLRRCTGWLCTTLASADEQVTNADDFQRLELFTDVDLDATFEAGDVIELRIAVLDDSEAWGMLAFGTDAYGSSLELKIDDTP